MPSSGFKTCALRSEEHTSELQSHNNVGCRLLLEKKQPQDHKRDAPSTQPARAPAAPAPAGAAHARRRPGATRTAARASPSVCCWSFFFNDTATTEIYTLSLHDALPI